MAVATSAILAGAALAVGVGGAYMNYRQQRAASQAQEDAAEEQKKIQGEQEASNVQAHTAEVRQQVREARIRRAQVLQSSENTGTSLSSGQLGAIGSVQTQLSSNIGQNVGAMDRAGRISASSQRVADLQSSAARSQMMGSIYGGVSNLGSSLFSQMGGFKTLSQGFGTGPVGNSLFSGNVRPTTPIYTFR